MQAWVSNSLPGQPRTFEANRLSSVRTKVWQVALCLPLILATMRLAARDPLAEPSSTWAQPYTIQQDKAAGVLTLSTPYYSVQHDLRHGGEISNIRLTYGAASNLLASPFETRVQDAVGTIYSDLFSPPARLSSRKPGLNPVVTVESELRGLVKLHSGIRVKTVYEYRWGYVKIHKELFFRGKNFGVKEVCPVAAMVAPSLSAYGYRDGLTEEEGATPFSFGSCHWGKLNGPGASGITTTNVPRYVMMADPGVEGLEWFVSSDLGQWDLQISGKRGQANCILSSAAKGAGLTFSVSPFQSTESPIAVPEHLVFDYYLAVPLLEGHAFRPWFHSSFNRNRGEWVSAEQVHRWAESGIQTVHCHNDGDYYGDGLFWRDGSYPPYPDMDKYDQVIDECHMAGIRVATYFSNKELHPSTPQFQQHGTNWGRMNRHGDLQHNMFREQSEFGAQMCLRSGWLDFLKASIDRVLTNNPLDGVYYDWNVALLCCNPKHEKLKHGQPAAGHWDIDELLNLMEWTRRRVGPRGLIIIHNTTTPMFATENFADDVVANEWGYGKWSGKGPNLDQLPLEWSLVGARPRGVISYGQLDAKAPHNLHRLFALEALLAGVTPWPASPDAFALYPVLKPIGRLEECRFADWRNQAVSLADPRSGAAIYSRPNEAWLVIGNLDDTPKETRVVLHPEKLPYPLLSLTTARLYNPSDSSSDAAPQPAPRALELQQLLGGGAMLIIPPESAVLVQVR